MDHLLAHHLNKTKHKITRLDYYYVAAILFVYSYFFFSSFFVMWLNMSLWLGI